MRLRTLYENVMRIILLLISIQFFSLTTNTGDNAIALVKKRQELKAEHTKSLTLSVFLEERSEKEGEGENEDDRAKLVHCVELAGLSSSAIVFANFLHTSNTNLFHIDSRFDLQPPLFKLHRFYLI